MYKNQALENNLADSNQSSKISERVMTKLKNSQAQIIVDFCEKKKEISEIITKEIEEKCEQVKENLKECKKQIEDILFAAKEKISYEENISNIRSEYFECLYQRIILNSTQGQKIIDLFYEDLVKLEKKRSNKFTAILKHAYQELKKLAFRVPRETEILVEKQIEEINQIILTNHRHIVDLKNEIELQTDNDSKNFINELVNLKLAWAKGLGEQINKSVQHIQSKISQLADDDIKQEQEKIKDGCFEFQNKLGSMNMVVVSFEDAEEWLKWVQMQMMTIDKSSQKIMLSFKHAAVAIFDRFFEEMKNIQEQITEAFKHDPITQSNIEMYTLSLQDIKDQYDVEFEKLQRLWTDEILEMEKVVEVNHQFLMAAANLWENHFNRVETIKLLVMLDVENCITNDNVCAENFYGKINILIDTLRQESTKERMDKSLDVIFKFLNSIEEVYNSQYSQECNIITKYKQFLTFEVEVLMAEIKRFLEVYPPDFSKDPKIQRRRASQTSEQHDPTEELLPNQLIYCKFQVDAIKNWQFGVWEAISLYLNVGRQELLADAEEWIEYRSIIIHKRLELRLCFHKLRILRVKENIYTQRFDELCCHQRRMEEHKLALDIYFKSIEESILKSEDLYKKVLEKYIEDTNRIENKIKNYQNSNLAKANLHILKSKFASSSESVEEIHLNQEKDVDEFMNKVKASGAKYVKQMRTFTEGGNFSIPEIKTYTKELNKLHMMYTKKLANLLKKSFGFKEKYQETMAKRHNELIIITTLVKDELSCTENKNAQLKLFEAELIREICCTKKTLDGLKDQFDNVIVNEATSLYGNYEFFEKAAQKFQDFTNDLITFGNILMHPVPLKLHSALSNDNITEPIVQQNIKLTKSNSEDVKSKIDKTQDKDYLKVLPFLNTINVPEHLFFNKLMNILKQNWTQIYKKSKDFYQEHTNFLLDSSQIPQTMDSFAEDLSKIFIYYLHQCEITWLNNAESFLMLLGNVISFFSEYFDIFNEAFSMLSLRKFREKFKKILVDIDTEKMMIGKVYRDLQKKLLPLHGHPKNKAHLEKLQKEQYEAQVKVDKQIRNSLRPHLENITNFYDTLIKQFTSLKNDIPKLILNVNEMVEIQNLLEPQFLGKRTLLKDYVENLKKVDCNDVLQKEILKNSQAYLEKRVENFESVDFKSWQHALSSTTENLNFTGIDENDTEIDFLFNLKEHYAKYVRNIQSQDLNKFHDSLKQEWEFAVKNVLDLYSVKYDESDLNIQQN